MQDITDSYLATYQPHLPQYIVAMGVQFPLCLGLGGFQSNTIIPFYWLTTY